MKLSNILNQFTSIHNNPRSYPVVKFFKRDKENNIIDGERVIHHIESSHCDKENNIIYFCVTFPDYADQMNGLPKSIMLFLKPETEIIRWQSFDNFDPFKRNVENKVLKKFEPFEDHQVFVFYETVEKYDEGQLSLF